MTLPPAAEALFDALERRATGSLQLTAAHGQRSTVSLVEGDVVSAEVGYGFQSLAQVLWREGQLTAQQLDALWSSGEGGEPAADSLQRLGLEAHAVESLRWRVQLRELAGRAEHVRFDADAAVPSGPVRLRGAHAVRAACEAGAPTLEGRRLRVRDLAACVPWLASPEEGHWLEGLREFVAGADVPAPHRALVAVLERAGLVEAVSEEAWQARRDAEEAAEAAGIAAAIEIEEAPASSFPLGWEGALQLDLPPEHAHVSVGEQERPDPVRTLTPTTLPVMEVTPDPARRPPSEFEVTNPGAPALHEASWAELIAMPEENVPVRATPSYDVPPTAAPAPPAPSAGEMPELILEAPVLEAPPFEEPPAAPLPEERAREEQAASEARSRAQADLIREMNEALRRAGAAPAEDWLSEGAPPAEAAPPPEAPVPEQSPADLPELLLDADDADLPALEMPDRPAPPVPSDEASSPPVDADLWRLLEFDPPQSGANMSASFEQALSSVDAQLEALVGTLPIEPDLPEVTFESTFGPEGDKPQGTDQTFEFELGSEEDELAGDPSDPAEAARLRRQRLMRRAMENLGAFQPRAAPTTEGAVEVNPATAPTASATQAPPPSSASAAAPAEPSSTPDESQLAGLIEKRYAEVKGGIDRFALLGIPREANKDGVKAAFLNLAKVFHPDRLPPSLASLAPKMTSVFEAIRESYELLYDDTKRKSYLHSLELKSMEEGLANASPSEQSEDAFKKAEVLFKKRDYTGAEELYTRSHELKPSANALSGRAWAIYMDPARKSEMPRAKQLMTEALKLDARCDRAHYQLGVVARVEGEADKAERHFREAVSNNPKHLEAAQELRLIEMRKKKKK